MATDVKKVAEEGQRAMVPTPPSKPMTAIETLAERDRQHAPVDRAKRALGLPK
jgi:hypothetical protein